MAESRLVDFIHKQNYCMMRLNIKSAICLILFSQAGLLSAQGAKPTQKRDTVNLGYFSQSSQAMSGAISTVTGEELEKSPVADLSQALTGRLSGVIMQQTNGELSKKGVLSYVRGVSTINGQEPLYVLDGVICSRSSIEYITPAEIENISVLKDASLTAIYGIQGANGVIIITTKRGNNEGLRVVASFDQSFQQMTRRPYDMSSSEYASLSNQAWQNDGAMGTAPYSAADVEAFANGSNRELYPNNNFYKMMFNPFASMQRAGLSVSAGNDKIKMFSNVNFMHQGGQFDIDQSTFKEGQVRYDSKAGNNYRLNYRINLDFKLNRILDGFIRVNGNVSKENYAGKSNAEIYKALFYLPPTMYGPYTPMFADPTNPSKMTGGEVLTNSYVDDPAYGMLNRSGFGRYTGTDIMAQTGLDLDMGFLTKGLKLGGRFAYQTNSSGDQIASQSYERWVRNNDPSVLGFDKIGEGTWLNTPLVYSKNGLFTYRLSTNAQLSYNRSFGKHSVDAMAYGYYQNFISERTDGVYVLPYNRVSSGITAAWSYDNKYFVKADAAYSGSEQFARDKRFVLTPAISAGWVLTEESFMSDIGWLDYLKLRVSAGQTANDQLGGGRFLYTDNLINGGNRYIENLNYMITEYQKGNPDLTAEKIFKQNYGVDITVFKDFSLSFDYFISNTDNMLINTIGMIPAFSGLTSSIYPPTNSGKMKNKGFEIGVNYFKEINNDISVYASANILYAENTIEDISETPMGQGYAYQYRAKGYSNGQPFGYLVDYSQGNGYFTSQQEIDKVYYSFGTPRLGDFRYKNLNGDKTSDGKDIIDEKDMAPVGYSAIPKVSYAVNLGVRYKAFELSCLIQGAGLSSRQYHNVIGFDESPYGGIYSDIHTKAWTPERAASGSEITFPALSRQQSVSRQPNDFFTMSSSYVRIKNLELAYSLPSSVLKLIHAREIRVVVNAQNLFTWDFLKTDCIDPEIASLDQFQNYRVFNVGLKLTF